MILKIGNVYINRVHITRAFWLAGHHQFRVFFVDGGDVEFKGEEAKAVETFIAHDCQDVLEQIRLVKAKDASLRQYMAGTRP